MYTVSIESDAAYRWSEVDDKFIEICTSCGADRVQSAERCGCGQPFASKKSGFFKAGFNPPKLSISFPNKCPKTLGPATKTLVFSTRRVTGVTGPGWAVTHLSYDVPTGKQMHSPLLWYYSGVVLAFFTVVFGLMSLFSVLDEPGRAVLTGAIALGCAAVLVWAIREYTWFRVAFFSHRAVIFKVRRREYAHELARLNRGWLK